LLNGVGHAAVDFEPGQRLSKDTAVSQRSPGSGAGLEVAKASLKGKQLPKSLDVAASERQLAEPGSHAFRRPSGAPDGMPIIAACRGAVDGSDEADSRRVVLGPIAIRRETQGDEQTA
jgi:hypothetical protein